MFSCWILCYIVGCYGTPSRSRPASPTGTVIFHPQELRSEALSSIGIESPSVLSSDPDDSEDKIKTLERYADYFGTFAESYPKHKSWITQYQTMHTNNLELMKTLLSEWAQTAALNEMNLASFELLHIRYQFTADEQEAVIRLHDYISVGDFISKSLVFKNELSFMYIYQKHTDFLKVLINPLSIEASNDEIVTFMKSVVSRTEFSKREIIRKKSVIEKDKFGAMKIVFDKIETAIKGFGELNKLHTKGNPKKKVDHVEETERKKLFKVIIDESKRLLNIADQAREEITAIKLHLSNMKASQKGVEERIKKALKISE